MPGDVLLLRQVKVTRIISPFKLAIVLKIHLRLDVGMTALLVPATRIQCNGQFTTLSLKRYHSLIPI
jgi:hypothetical protein